VGPTLTKMFLVSTHLRYPERNLLTAGCPVTPSMEALLSPLTAPPNATKMQVGDGAGAAYAFLFPGAAGAKRAAADPQALLLQLHAGLLSSASQLEPRLLPMIQWFADAPLLPIHRSWQFDHPPPYTAAQVCGSGANVGWRPHPGGVLFREPHALRLAGASTPVPSELSLPTT
jgi:hypothetical protein